MAAERPIAGAKRVMIFGGTGMVGLGVIRECLLDPEVESVVTVGRKATGVVDAKLREVVHADMLNLEPIQEEFKNVDACFYTLGVTSTSVDKPTYERITKDYTVSVADELIKENPNMTFVYVSGMGTDPESSTHWARIKGETENYILEKPWHGYVFRPGMIRSMNNEESKTPLYRYMYKVLKPAVALVHWIAPSSMTTTELIGTGFLELAKHGSTKKIFENGEINAITPKKATL